MAKRSALYALLIVGVFFVFLILIARACGGAESPESQWSSGSGPHIGVVDIKGPIADSRDALAELHTLRKDGAIRAIVVRIDSPGGAVAPSQEIYQAIVRAREAKKVVCSLGTVAASGGYYIASACDQIIASPGTITGSIGVISELPHVQGLLDLFHVEVDTIKSGRFKDAGSPLRKMTADERSFFQQFVDGVYRQFLDDVAKGRHLPVAAVKPLADGRILTGQQALEAHLVDQLGNFEDALDAAARLAGQKGEPVPVFPKKGGRSWVAELLRGASDGARPRGSIELRDPRF